MPEIKVLKRDGKTLAPWEPEKITRAVEKAFKAVKVPITKDKLNVITFRVNSTLASVNAIKPKTRPLVIEIESIQNTVEYTLRDMGYWEVARAYIVYREQRADIRRGKNLLLDVIQEIDIEATKDNANVGNTMAGKVLQISEAASSYFYSKRVIPEVFSTAHDSGDIHIHDKAWYGKGINCCQIPYTKLAREGFNTGHGFIRPAHSLKTAAMHASIIIQANQNEMYGGQSYPDFDNQFVATGVLDYQRGKIRRDLQYGAGLAGKQLEELNTTDVDVQVEKILDHKGFQAMEALIYNLNTMHSRGGGQIPFSSINIGDVQSEDAAKVCEWILKAFEAGLGKGEQPIFPNICFKIKAGVNMYPTDPYYLLFKLAQRVCAKRLNPSWVFCDSSFNKGGDISYMGCRTRVVADRHGESTTIERGNISFTTENLPRLALKALNKFPTDQQARIEYFFELHNNMLELIVQQLLHRFHYICNTLKAKDFPFLLGQHLYRDAELLKPDDSIYMAARHGTLTLGFIGLAECLTALVGSHHGEDENALFLGHKIISRIRGVADAACNQYDLNFSVIATPAEGLSGRFTKLDKAHFGHVVGVTDKDYYTNSYHLPVSYNTSFQHKIATEGPFHKYCNGGHISYVELQSMPPEYNLEVVEQIVMSMAASDMGYAAINYPVDYCNSCGTSNNVIPHSQPCPICGEIENIDRVRRITGYLSTLNRFNDAKVTEESDRKVHV